MYFVIYAAFTASLMPLVAGIAKLDYAAVIIVISLALVYPGMYVQNKIANEYKRGSIVVLLLGLTILICNVVTPTQIYINIIAKN